MRIYLNSLVYDLGCGAFEFGWHEFQEDVIRTTTIKFTERWLSPRPCARPSEKSCREDYPVMQSSRCDNGGCER